MLFSQLFSFHLEMFCKSVFSCLSDHISLILHISFARSVTKCSVGFGSVMGASAAMSMRPSIWLQKVPKYPVPLENRKTSSSQYESYTWQEWSHQNKRRKKGGGYTWITPGPTPLHQFYSNNISTKVPIHCDPSGGET